MFGTGIDVVPNLPKCPVPVVPAVCLGTYRNEHTLDKMHTSKYHYKTHCFELVGLSSTGLGWFGLRFCLRYSNNFAKEGRITSSVLHT